MCSGHGQCQDRFLGSGECHCHEGFHGTACEMCELGRYGPNCTGGEDWGGVGVGFLAAESSLETPAGTRWGHWETPVLLYPTAVCDCAHGLCQEGLQGDGSCVCNVGWQGLRCDQSEWVPRGRGQVATEEAVPGSE